MICSAAVRCLLLGSCSSAVAVPTLERGCRSAHSFRCSIFEVTTFIQAKCTKYLSLCQGVLKRCKRMRLSVTMSPLS